MRNQRRPRSNALGTSTRDLDASRWTPSSEKFGGHGINRRLFTSEIAQAISMGLLVRAWTCTTTRPSRSVFEMTIPVWVIITSHCMTRSSRIGCSHNARSLQKLVRVQLGRGMGQGRTPCGENPSVPRPKQPEFRRKALRKSSIKAAYDALARVSGMKRQMSALRLRA
jgi:hypothetical protein